MAGAGGMAGTGGMAGIGGTGGAAPVPEITVINNVKDNLPADYGSDPSVSGLFPPGPGGSWDIDAGSWVTSYSGTMPATAATIYFAYLDTDLASQFAEPSASCQGLNLSESVTITMTIDNSDSEFPETVCELAD